MRPYLAVIADSFRAAFASRVLWIVLILITLFLLGLAPMGSRRVLSYELKFSDFLDPLGLARQLHKEFKSQGPSPGQRIWNLLDQPTQKALRDAVEGENRELGEVGFQIMNLLSQLNGLLDRRDFYDEEAWQNVTLDDEALELLEKGNTNLSDDELRRLNRLLLESAYRGLIAVSPPTSIQFQYATLDMGTPLPIPEDNFASLVRQILAGFMDFFVGVVAVFIAILVTSSIIPQTFETGSIELLLSKPISRSLLFLAKFLGGCAFILLNATYLIAGLWLIAGLRFHVWEPKLLLCIPVFMFLFMVYFSVSALAGLVWRSAIVSVVVTLLFWAVCFSVGLTKTGIENVMLRPNRITAVVPTGKAILSVNESNRVHQWDADSLSWEPVFESNANPVFFTGPFGMPGRRMLGPIYNHHAQQLLAAELPWNSMGGTADGAYLEAGVPDRQWARVSVAEVPSGTVALFPDPDGNVLAIARDGVYRLPADKIDVAERHEDDKLFREWPAFEPVFRDQENKSWMPQRAAMDPESQRLVVWTRKGLVVLRPGKSNGIYETETQRNIDVEDQPFSLAFAGDTVLIARSDGEVNVLDSETLKPAGQYRPEGQNQPRFVRAAPSGRWFAIIFHNGNLWLFDARKARMHRPPITGQGDISAAVFDNEDHLMVADRTTRVTRYRMDTFQIEEQFTPQMELLERIYRYVAVPVYTVFPRPGELSNTIQYLLTEQETSGPGVEVRDLATAQVKIDPWGPVYSSLGFVVVVLLASCWYIYRAEF